MSWLERTFDLTRRQAIALVGDPRRRDASRASGGCSRTRRAWRAARHDELGYAEMARQLIARGVYGYYSTSPNAFTTPGYPLFVTGVFKLANLLGVSGGGEFAALRAAQMLLGVLAVWLVFLLGRRVGGRARGPDRLGGAWRSTRRR